MGFGSRRIGLDERLVQLLDVELVVLSGPYSRESYQVS